jgi:hypothetical protein
MYRDEQSLQSSDRCPVSGTSVARLSSDDMEPILDARSAAVALARCGRHPVGRSWLRSKVPQVLSFSESRQKHLRCRLNKEGGRIRFVAHVV